MHKKVCFAACFTSEETHIGYMKRSKILQEILLHFLTKYSQYMDIFCFST
jgi:hypothetical protein